ncbi:uncharacterized protein, partial [Haliotis cracherodii]|uniref:uncharacterized protein n=1 Tax=Haliotis cracherodii TaxID=6455 RepID=UPI0039E8BA34
MEAVVQESPLSDYMEYLLKAESIVRLYGISAKSGSPLSDYMEYLLKAESIVRLY